MKEYVLKAAQTGFAAGTVFDLDAPGVDAGAAGLRTADRRMADEKGESALDYSAAGSPEEELRRFDKAVLALKQELTAAAREADEKSAAIFEAERILLEDEEYAGAIRRRICEEGQEAARAARQTGQDVARAFAASESSYIRGRCDDVNGITQRLVGILRGDERRTLAVPSILVAEELSPAQLSGFDPALLLEILTVRGTPSSHVSVIAGNLGIPYVYGSSEAAKAARACSRLIIDGERLILDPEEEMYQQALQQMEESRKQEEDAAADISERRTRVFANIAGPEDIEELLASGAEGVGLMRSEFLFLGRETAPSEEEQFEAYRRVAEAMGEKETVIRTMDLGSDKRPAWLPLPDEKNPALGWRGLRISLKERELFKTQLRALLRAAAYGNVKVMVPMVTSVREIEAVEACMSECAKELTRAGIPFRLPPLGAMVETPAAALLAEELSGKVDFFSVGTNDLTQYTLALDREAEGLEEYDDPSHEAVLRLIRMTARAAAENHIPISVCGELAGREEVVKSLIQAGVNKLSVSVPKVRAVMRRAAEAEKALEMEKPPKKETEIEPDRIRRKP